MANFLLLILTFLSFGLCHLPAANTHPGIRREYDGGTKWDTTETRHCPLSPAIQDVQPAPVLTHIWTNRRAVPRSQKQCPFLRAKRQMKVWSRSNIIGILLLLLLAGDVETNPGPTTDEQRLLQEGSLDEQEPLLPVSKGRLQGVIYENLPRVPLYPVPVDQAGGLLKRGAHLVYKVCWEPYRPCYRSALVLKVEGTKIHAIMNSSDGVKTESFKYSQTDHYIIKYPHCCEYSRCHYTDDEAVNRAEQRLKWGENCYHCLYNNSHHFVTWAKTGRENSLADIIESLTCQKDNHLTPVLTKVPISDLNNVGEGDHIMMGTQHFLVASTDTEQNTYTGYTCRSGVVVKEDHKLDTQHTFRIDYSESCSSMEAIENAQKVEQREWSASGKRDSDKFVTKMKTGRKYALNEQCLFMEENEFSHTKVVAGIAIDEGDHLMVKNKNGIYKSVLVLKHAGQNSFIVTPDLNSETLEQYGTLVIKKDTEVYRINYKQSLPVDDVFQRAMSDKALKILQECGTEFSKFVSWAKIGRKVVLTDFLQFKSQIAQVCPFQRDKIMSIDEMQVGDHLIRSYGIPRVYHTHWWHFMITDKKTSNFSVTFKTIYCYRGHISETEETLDPVKDDIYRISYPESLPVTTAIERARSKLGKHHFSPLGRMWFIRWAKTGSEDGIEVDFLLNNAIPASKSRICTFAQLNQGDYLVEEENKITPWHHYLVEEVKSHSSCSAIETWNGKIAKRELTFTQSSKYYRLNYNDGACISPGQVIDDAQELLGKHIIKPDEFKYKRQKLVNYLKTGNVMTIKIDSLQDDRTLLRRERVKSALDLQPGDHIERPFTLSAYHHMMVTKKPTHDRKCTVIHFTSTEGLMKSASKAYINEEEVDIFKKGDNVFLIKYPERYEPDWGIDYLKSRTWSHEPSPVKQFSSTASQVTPYNLVVNNCEHLIMKATVDECVSIQVTEHQHYALQRTTAAVIVAGASLGHVHVAHACAGAAAKGIAHAGLKAAAKSGAKAAVKGSAKAGAKAGANVVANSPADSAEALFQLGFRAALSGTAIGIVAGVAVAINLAFEGPLLARSVYKLHRKKKFDQITQVEFKRGIVQESFISANTFVGAVGGAIVGQVAIPVPALGAAVGGAVGGIVGQVCGRAEGWAAGKLISDPRAVTILPLTTVVLFDMPPLIGQEKTAEK